MPESQAIWIKIVDFLLLTSLLASLIFFATVSICIRKCVLILKLLTFQFMKTGYPYSFITMFLIKKVLIFLQTFKIKFEVDNLDINRNIIFTVSDNEYGPPMY